MIDLTKKDLKEWGQEMFVRGAQYSKENVSNMTSEIFKKQDISIGNAVEKYINGKLDKIYSAQEDNKIHMLKQDVATKELGDKLDGHAKTDADFQDEMRPIIEAKTTVMNLGNLLGWFLGITIAIFTVLNFIK